MKGEQEVGPYSEPGAARQKRLSRLLSGQPRRWGTTYMDTTLLAALVAAAVSSLGLLVQIHLSRSERKSSREQISLQSLSEIQRTAYVKIVEMETEDERLRIYLWELEGRLRNMQQAERTVPTDEAIRALQVLFEQLQEKAFNTMEKWAEVRPHIPSGIEYSARVVRHEFLNAIRAVISGGEILRRVGPSFDHRPMLDRIAHTRELLDEMTGVLKAIRENMISPNKGVELMGDPQRGSPNAHP